MVKGGTVVTHKCIRTETSKIRTFDLRQTKNFDCSSFSNRRHHCNILLKLRKEIWQYILNHQITITAEYLLSSLNVEAD